MSQPIPSLDDRARRVSEVAKIFDVRTTTVREWLRDGKLIGMKLPGSNQWRIAQSEIQRFAQTMYGDTSE